MKCIWFVFEASFLCNIKGGVCMGQWASSIAGRVYVLSFCLCFGQQRCNMKTTNSTHNVYSEPTSWATLSLETQKIKRGRKWGFFHGLKSINSLSKFIKNEWVGIQTLFVFCPQISKVSHYLSDSHLGSPAFNYGGAGSGFIVTPYAGSTVVAALCVFPADTSSDRDPTSFDLYGQVPFQWKECQKITLLQIVS